MSIEVEKAARYRAGWWELPGGWRRLPRPMLVDLEHLASPRSLSRWRRAASELTRVERATLGPEERGLVHAWRAATQGRFDPEPFLEFLEREARWLVCSTYHLGDAAVAVSLNLRYGDLVAAQLLCWDRDAAGHTHLGKLDFFRVAQEAREAGCRTLAAGTWYEYKEALFRGALIEPVASEAQDPSIEHDGRPPGG